MWCPTLMFLRQPNSLTSVTIPPRQLFWQISHRKKYTLVYILCNNVKQRLFNMPFACNIKISELRRCCLFQDCLPTFHGYSNHCLYFDIALFTENKPLSCQNSGSMQHTSRCLTTSNAPSTYCSYSLACAIFKGTS